MKLARPNHLDHPILGLLSFFAIVANVSSLFFTLKKLKVHEHIKRVLLWGIVHNIAGSLVLLIGYLMMVFSPENIFVACAMFSIPLQQCLNGGHVMTSLMGVIRYYMAKNTAMSKRIDHRAISVGSVVTICFHMALNLGKFNIEEKSLILQILR